MRLVEELLACTTQHPVLIIRPHKWETPITSGYMRMEATVLDYHTPGAHTPTTVAITAVGNQEPWMLMPMSVLADIVGSTLGRREYDAQQEAQRYFDTVMQHLRLCQAEAQASAEECRPTPNPGRLAVTRPTDSDGIPHIPLEELEKFGKLGVDVGHPGGGHGR